MLVSAIDGHRIWAASYDAGPNPILALEERLMRPLSADRAIDVGCGTGRWTRRLNGIGVDFCEEMLREASRKPGLRGRLLVAGANALPFQSAVSDLTLCSFSIGYFRDLPSAVSEMARVTRRGGHVVISDLHPAAIAAGWTRSFRAGGTIYEMEHSGTAVEEALASAGRCGLVLDRQHDACFGEPERPIFEAAGKSLDQVAGTPAVWIGIWTKP